MTDIDPKSEIELHTASEHVVVRVPLDGSGPDARPWTPLEYAYPAALPGPLRFFADRLDEVRSAENL